nr:hypothetical protein Iba_chr07bCG6890 [Ipomoea batatas]
MAGFEVYPSGSCYFLSPRDNWKQAYRRNDGLPPALPVIPELKAVIAQKRSFVEGNRTPCPHPILFGLPGVHGTALEGRGEAPRASVPTARDGAPGLRGSAILPGPGSMRVVDRFQAESDKGVDSIGGCPATMGSSGRGLPWGSWDIGMVFEPRREDRPEPRELY